MFSLLEWLQLGFQGSGRGPQADTTLSLPPTQELCPWVELTGHIMGRDTQEKAHQGKCRRGWGAPRIRLTLLQPLVNPPLPSKGQAPQGVTQKPCLHGSKRREAGSDYTLYLQ